MSTDLLRIPRGGVANASALAEQGETFTALPSMLNVVLYDVEQDRPRGGTREGSSALFAGTLGKGEIQGLATVNRPSTTGGFKLGAASDAGAGTSSAANPLVGNVFAIDAVLGGEWSHYFDVAPDGPAGVSVSAEYLSQDGATVYVVANYQRVSDSKNKFRVRALNAATGAVLWTYDHPLVTVGESLNQIVAGSNYLFLILDNSFVVVLSRTTGAQVDRWNNTWAQKNVAAVLVNEAVSGPLGTTMAERLYVAFMGSTAAGLIHGGALADGTVLATGIAAGECAQHTRSGVMKLAIMQPPVGPGLPSTPVLTQVAWPAAPLASSDPRFEANHGYFRFSERSNTTPFGCNPVGMKAAYDGSIYVIRTNRGWGPDANWRPGWENEPDPRKRRAPVTLCKISALGVMLWEGDPANYQGVFNGSGYYAGQNHWNDIYQPIMASIAVSPTGQIFVGGRQNSIGESAWSVDGNGTPVFAFNLVSGSTQIRDNALFVDPSDHNPIFGGDRNTAWNGSGGVTNAHLWKLSAANGSLAWFFDLGAAVSVLAVVTTADGRVILGTDKV